MCACLSIAIFLLSLIPASAESGIISPDGSCSVALDQNEFKEHTLKIMRGEKRLFLTTAGYGGHTAVSWSPDSRYLAVVEHGTKTSMNLAVYLIDADGVSLIALPDFRLNILGRFQKVEGGRYQFDEALKWKTGSVLEFETRGSLIDGASNPKDFPENWYSFKVVMEFNAKESRLLAVTPKEDEQDGTEQPATRPESKSEGSDKPQPEAEGRSR